MPCRWQMSSTNRAWYRAGSARPSTQYTREHCQWLRAKFAGVPTCSQWYAEACTWWTICASSSGVRSSFSMSRQVSLNSVFPQ